MASWWRALLGTAQRHPWPTNVLLYSTLFSSGDVLQQRMRGGPMDWQQTRCVATMAVTFHGNFNFVWMRLLERALPGRSPRIVLAKVFCDQAVAFPLGTAVFYTGMSILQGKEDVFLEVKQKFWNTYKTGLLYWPFVQVSSGLQWVVTTWDCGIHWALMDSLLQFTNFILMPVQWRTAYTGACAFLWATFVCYSQQAGDGTLKSVFSSLWKPLEAETAKRPQEK